MYIDNLTISTLALTKTHGADLCGREVPDLDGVCQHVLQAAEVAVLHKVLQEDVAPQVHHEHEGHQLRFGELVEPGREVGDHFGEEGLGVELGVAEEE